MRENAKTWTQHTHAHTLTHRDICRRVNIQENHVKKTCWRSLRVRFTLLHIYVCFLRVYVRKHTYTRTSYTDVFVYTGNSNSHQPHIILHIHTHLYVGASASASREEKPAGARCGFGLLYCAYTCVCVCIQAIVITKHEYCTHTRLSGPQMAAAAAAPVSWGLICKKTQKTNPKIIC